MHNFDLRTELESSDNLREFAIGLKRDLIENISPTIATLSEQLAEAVNFYDNRSVMDRMNNIAFQYCQYFRKIVSDSSKIPLSQGIQEFENTLSASLWKKLDQVLKSGTEYTPKDISDKFNNIFVNLLSKTAEEALDEDVIGLTPLHLLGITAGIAVGGYVLIPRLIKMARYLLTRAAEITGLSKVATTTGVHEAVPPVMPASQGHPNPPVTQSTPGAGVLRRRGRRGGGAHREVESAAIAGGASAGAGDSNDHHGAAAGFVGLQYDPHATVDNRFGANTVADRDRMDGWESVGVGGRVVTPPFRSASETGGARVTMAPSPLPLTTRLGDFVAAENILEIDGNMKLNLSVIGSGIIIDNLKRQYHEAKEKFEESKVNDIAAHRARGTFEQYNRDNNITIFKQVIIANHLKVDFDSLIIRSPSMERF